MGLEEAIREKLVFMVFTQKEFKSKEEVISFLAEQLSKRGHVKNGFSHAVLEREKKFPTGLYLGSINVAIPHTDIKYVQEAGIAIATLKQPVLFSKMDEPEKSIPVHIVFLIAVTNPKSYVELLAKLTNSFSNRLFLQSLYSERNPVKVTELLREVLILKPTSSTKS